VLRVKRKRPKFNAVKEVKAMAREKVGSPPPRRVIPDPRTKPEKYPRKALLEDD
jgi:hypothetical protein